MTRKFSYVFTKTLSDSIYNAITSYNDGYFSYNDQTITDYEFYIMILSLARTRYISPIYNEVLDNDLLSTDTFLSELILHKFCKRWDNIFNSLSVNYSAFDVSKKTVLGTVTTDGNTVTNFDVFANESLNTQIQANDKENTIKNDNVITTNDTITSYSQIDFNKALDNFIKSTEFNIIDVIIEDIVKFLTIDVM